jgi:hypothetical protein
MHLKQYKVTLYLIQLKTECPYLEERCGIHGAIKESI